MKTNIFFLWSATSFVVFFGTETVFAQGNFWEPTRGPRFTTVTALVSDAAGDILVATYGGDVFRSSDRGESWVRIGFVGSIVRALAIDSSGEIFVGTEDYGVFRSRDDGRSWDQVNSGLTVVRVTSLAVSSTGHLFAGTRLGGLFRSTDDGTRWSFVGLSGSVVYALLPLRDGAILAADRIKGAGHGGIYRSTDDGENWTLAGLSSNAVISLSANSNGDIFAGTDDGSGIHRSIEKGNIWIELGLRNTSVQSIMFDPNGNVYVGTLQGVFRSLDNGANWADLNSGLTTLAVTRLLLHPDRYIFAGTDGQGVFRSTQRVSPVELPTKFSLDQNYPNPFNPGTQVNYALPGAVYTQLVVYDLLGRVAKVLVNEMQNAGYHTAVWIGRDEKGASVTSGVYFYRLQAGQFVETKKMLLVR